MEVRDGYLDARECARRCLDAMDETQDKDTRQSLWNAASRYAQRARELRATAKSTQAAAPERGHWRGLVTPHGLGKW